MCPNALCAVLVVFCLIASINHPVLALNDTNPDEHAAKANYSVRVMNSQVPNDQYLYEAVGMLQVALEVEDDFGRAFPRFLRAFQANHQNQEWKLAGGCNLMLLSNQTTYIQLEEVLSNTMMMIRSGFSVVSFVFFALVLCTRADKVNGETHSIKPTAVKAAKTLQPLAPYSTYSVHAVSSNVPNALYTYTAVGMLQVCLDEELTFSRALAKFLQNFQAQFTAEKWNLSSGCNVIMLADNATYIELLEDTTNTQVTIFD
ncbi:hypothetical protein HUJ04_011951 [Dendroctonus ponderosae]|nr:hypothetical protein HUJ04_011951 [Dendroctonus ponderosae]